jgi:hypothetical protein
MTSQQIIDKLIQIELYRIHPRRNPTKEELDWEQSHTFFAKPFQREYQAKIDLDFSKEYIIHHLDCEFGSPKVKLVGENKLYDYKDFTYSLNILPKN